MSNQHQRMHSTSSNHSSSTESPKKRQALSPISHGMSSSAEFPSPPPFSISSFSFFARDGPPSLEARILVLEARLDAASIENHSSRFAALEAHIHQLHQRADQQDQRIHALEQRVEQIGRQCLDGMQQLAASMADTETRIAALREEQKLETSNLNSNLLASFGHLSKVDAVLFVLSEQSRKIDEKLRACEHQRLKAEAVLRFMTNNATSLEGYNALVDAGMHRIPELQQRIAQNKKDLLIGMSARLKHDYNIDVIDENTGQMKTSLFPRPIHRQQPQQKNRDLSANERAEALAAKAEQDEVRIIERMGGGN